MRKNQLYLQVMGRLALVLILGTLITSCSAPQAKVGLECSRVLAGDCVRPTLKFPF